MPHNLYLHSSIVQTRRYALTADGRGEAVRLSGLDSALALGAATVVNVAILVLAAATFHAGGLTRIADIAQADRLLAPLLGSGAATLFALGLLASGQNSAITATLTGQIVMEGFVKLRLAPWKRRLATPLAGRGARGGGGGGGGRRGGGQAAGPVPGRPGPAAALRRGSLWCCSHGDRSKMGGFANGPWTAGLAWSATGLIVALNLILIAQVIWPHAPHSALTLGAGFSISARFRFGPGRPQAVPIPG